MTTVVTGANGHVGANLIRALLDRGRTVRALVHTNRQAIENLNIDMFRGNVCDLPSLCEAFKDAEVVYHLAARISLSMDEWHPECGRGMPSLWSTPTCSLQLHPCLRTKASGYAA
jgi:nucleoside-diphosphate-sugar epimerase